jgi:hypothetical protein
MKTKGLAVSELIPDSDAVLLGDFLPCFTEFSTFSSSLSEVIIAPSIQFNGLRKVHF